VGRELAQHNYTELTLKNKKSCRELITAIRKYKRSNDEISAKVSRVLHPPQPNVSDIPNKKVCTSQENVLTECFKDHTEKNILTERNADQGHGKVFNNCEIHYWNRNPTQL